MNPKFIGWVGSTQNPKNNTTTIIINSRTETNKTIQKTPFRVSDTRAGCPHFRGIILQYKQQCPISQSQATTN